MKRSPKKNNINFNDYKYDQNNFLSDIRKIKLKRNPNNISENFQTNIKSKLEYDKIIENIPDIKITNKWANYNSETCYNYRHLFTEIVKSKKE